MKRLRLFTHACVLLFVVVVMSPRSMMGQTFTGDILGGVTDPTGAAVVGAEITARNLQTDIASRTVSGEDGRYVFSRLVPGNYEISAVLPGFKRFVASDITLNVGNRVTLNLQLEVGEVSSTVEVKAAEELVKTDDVVLGQVVTEKSITALPLNGRNYIQLAQLSPGVVQNLDLSTTQSWTGRPDTTIVVAGLRENDTSYLLDGIETRAFRWGNSGFRPSIDAVKEFNVQRNAFTADQGWGTTVVNTVLRSGSNELHGTVFEFIRNDRLDARNFFDGAKKPPFKQNQYGFSIGGPVIKSRLFFFGNYEGFRQRLSNTLQGRYPSQEEMQGRFSTPVIDPLTGQPFPNNTIPQDRINPVIKKVIPFFPAPNRPADPRLNYVRSPSLISDSDQLHAKVDFKLSDSDQMFVRYSWVDEDLLRPGLAERSGVQIPLANKNVAISHTHVFGPKTVNEFRVGYNRNEYFFLAEEAFGPNVASDIGLQNVSKNPANFALPLFAIVGYSDIGRFLATQETIDDVYQFTENLTASRGKHTLKLGGDLRRNPLYFTHDSPGTPAINFDSFYTGNAVGDFLLGLADFAQLNVGDTSANASRSSWAVYLQDDWKVHPKLSLSLGLRYEYHSPFSEENSKFGYVDFKTLQFVTGQKRVFQPDRNNLAPRFGFAYSPFSKTAIRGGFGVYYDLISGNEVQFHGVQLPPNAQIVSFSNTRPIPNFRVSDLFPPLQSAPMITPKTTDPRNRTPYVYLYNFNLQREIQGVLVEAGYVGSSGHKLNRRFNLNAAFPDPNIPLAQRRPFRRL